MLMNLPLFLSHRLSLSDSGKRNSPSVAVAMTATALSVAVMILSIAIVAGFKREITSKVTGFNSHIQVLATDEGNSEGNVMTLTPSLQAEIDSVGGISSCSLQLSVPAVLKTSGNFKGIYLRGFANPEMEGFMTSNIEEGEIPDFSDKKNENRIVISSAAASRLGLGVGDRVDCYFFSDDVRVRPMKVAGIYNSHFDSYDNLLAFTGLSLIQKLSGLKENQGTSLQINVRDFNRLDEVTSALHSRLVAATADGRLYRNYIVQNAKVTGAGYFQWLGLLDTNVWVILTLMTIVAAVTLIGGMLIIILDKKRFIGIMRSVGMQTRTLRSVFIWLALRIALAGMLIGNGLALLLVWIQDKYRFIPLDAESYYIDFVPVQISWESILILNAGVAVVIYLILILPSRFAAKISPAEAMRSE